ncbi:MAG: hypothetical protein K9G71_12960 [Rhodobacteraceae bacterium]|nr:hypothetical protein [Paracoccaceae bacterium]MCF8515266.1 hypothetical protein [Paracoccaceae bacterium]MCF8519550.1 hypothetical protein [Paracoccaceae bacterium]
MFRKEGFVPATEIRKLFGRWNLDDATSKEIEERQRIRKYRKMIDDTQRREGNADKPRKLFTSDEALAAIPPYKVTEEIAEAIQLAFRRFLFQTNLSICGPNDISYSISNDVIGPPLLPWSEVARRWYFLSDPFLVISVKEKIELAKAAKLVLASDTLTHPTFLYTEAKRKLNSLAEQESAALSLLPYEGYSLAISEKDVPDRIAIRKSFNLDSTKSQEGTEVAQRGRPRKMEDAASAYAERFPTGHGGYSWKAVLEILREEQGVHVSEDTLRAAIQTL